MYIIDSNGIIQYIDTSYSSSDYQLYTELWKQLYDISFEKKDMSLEIKMITKNE